MAQHHTSASDLVFNKDSEEVTFSAARPIQFQSGPNKRWVAVAVGVGVVLAITGLILLVLALTTEGPSCSETGKSDQLPPTPTTPGGGACLYSAEARRVELASFLKRAQSMYYDVNANEVPWQPDIGDSHHHVKSK